MKLSDDDFDAVHTELAKHPLGALAIRDYEPVLDPDTDLPSIDNAFLMSITQHDDRGGKLAHTRIDIRGEDGLIHTSFERDHVHFEPVDETSIGKTLLVDAAYQEPTAFRLEKILDMNDQEVTDEETGDPLMRQVAVQAPVITVVPKGVTITADHVERLLAKGFRKIATKQMTPTEIAAALLPLLESHHQSLPEVAMPVLEALSVQAKQRIAAASEIVTKR